MLVKVKVLYESKYRDGDKFDEALERWESKGWAIADTVYSFKEQTNVAIIYRVVESTWTRKEEENGN